MVTLKRRNRHIPVLTVVFALCIAGAMERAQQQQQQTPAMSPAARGIGQEEAVTKQPPATRFFYPTGPDIFVPLPASRLTFNAKGDSTGGREWMLVDLKQRIRDVRQGPDGMLYLLTDAAYGALLRIERAD